MQKSELIIDGLYRIKKEDLKRCARVAALAFLDDESSKFLLSSNLTFETLYNYYLVIYKAAYDSMYMFADSSNIDGFIIIAPIKNADISIWNCLKEGAGKILLTQGLGILLRSLIYENNCMKIRNNIALVNSWYIFQFGVIPEKQGKKLGSKTILPVLHWFDSNKFTCYLETFRDVNVKIYNHFGFSLKMISTLSNKKINQFAMLRNYHNIS